MKIGIVTLTGSDNYGNVLQNYAVQEVLSACGVDVETIKNTTRYGRYLSKNTKIHKWTPTYIKEYVLNQLNYRYNIKNTGRGIVRTICFYKKNKRQVEYVKQERKKAFSNFTEARIRWATDTIDINYPWTKEQVAKYDYYVSGSDQVWNPVYPSTSSINFLQFAPKEKRITFSPSFGIDEIPYDLKEQYTKWLSEIPYLSVREEQGQKIIRELCGCEAKVLCDPTMVLTKAEWIRLETKPEFLKDDKYMLTYFLGDRTRKYDNYINSIAQKHNLKVISLYDVLDLVAYSVSPQEFIYLIHHANMVCTDSFHGAVFSILMNTNFITFSRMESGGSMESRIHTLLSAFGLENRDYRKVKREDWFETDFSGVAFVLEEKRKQVFDFLRNALNSANITGETCVTETEIYQGKKQCCGCNACALACPVQCITMQCDEEGFLYPVVDRTKCIQCNRCHQVCPVQNEMQQRLEFDKECYVGYSTVDEIRKNSSSGGMFTLIARTILEKGGSVIGAAFDERFDVEHQEVTNFEQLNKFQGSKYVQSNIGITYKKTKELLEEGKLVLFSGTPCQIKGLYTYLGNKTYGNLLTQDIVCHGVPSPVVWQKYVVLKKKRNIQKISFRDKTFGWHYFSMRINSDDGKYCKRLDEDWYLRLFLDNTILRPICYDCPMKKEGSCADITLADCWKSGNVTNQIKDTDEGLSLIIVNTEKGAKTWKYVTESNDVSYEKVDTEKALASQSAIRTSVSPNPKRAMFFDAMNKVEFMELVQSWYKDNVMSKVRKRIIYYKTKMIYLLKSRNG